MNTNPPSTSLSELTWLRTRLLEAPLIAAWGLLVADAYWVASDGFNVPQKAMLWVAFSIAFLGLFGLDRLLRSEWKGGTRFFSVLFAMHAWLCWVAASTAMTEKPDSHGRQGEKAVREILPPECVANPPEHQESQRLAASE